MKIALAIGFLMMMGGCSNATQEEEGPTAGARAPNLLLMGIDGELIDLHAWIGKPVLLEVFGVHCGSCASMMPEFLEYWKAYGEDGTVRMLSVDLGPNFDGLGAQSEEEVRQWKSEWQANWTFALDDERAQVNAKYPHVARPTTYLIDDESYVAWTHGGYATFDQLKSETDQVLAA